MTLFPRQRIGLAVGSDHVAAVSMRGGRVLAVSAATIASDDALGEALRRCLAEVSGARRWRRAEVHVALEPSYAQVRRVSEVPMLPSPEQRHALADLTRSEHFVGRLEELSVFVGDQDTSADLWVMCVDTSVVSLLASVVAEAKLVLARLVPSMDVLVAASDATITKFSREDGSGVVGHATVVDGRIAKLWRALPAAERETGTPSPPLEIRRLLDGIVAEEAMPLYVAAVAAVVPLARSRFRSPTMLSVPSRASTRGSLPMLIGVAAALTLVAFTAPGLRAHRDADRAAAMIDAAAPMYRAAAVRRARLDSLTTLHNALVRFRSASAPVLPLMSALGEALPDDGVVTSLTVDSGSAQVTVLVSSATEVLQRLGSNRGLDSVALTGAITRERIAAVPQITMAGGFGPSVGPVPQRELERAAIRVFSARTRSPESAASVAAALAGDTKVLARNATRAVVLR